MYIYYLSALTSSFDSQWDQRPCLFFLIFSKRRYERSIIHINLCSAIAAGIALFLGGLRLTKIPVSIRKVILYNFCGNKVAW